MLILFVLLAAYLLLLVFLTCPVGHHQMEGQRDLQSNVRYADSSEHWPGLDSYGELVTSNLPAGERAEKVVQRVNGA
jgi:hypothetical protein